MSARRPLRNEDASAVLARHRDLFDDSALRRATTLAAPLGILGFTIFAVWWLAIPFSQIGPGLASLAKFIALMFPPSTGGHLHLLLKAMGETLAIAFLGTLIATVFAFPVSFLAAKNTSPHPLIRFAIRRGLDTIRGVDALIWALVFVGVVGLGPFAGNAHLFLPLSHFIARLLEIGVLARREVIVVGDLEKRLIDQQQRRMISRGRQARHQGASNEKNSENIHDVHLLAS